MMVCAEWYYVRNGGIWRMVFVVWEERNGRNGIRRAGNA